jgi:hypothetical protein
LIAAWRSTIEWKLPRRIRLRASTEKKLSTAFSHDPEVGVKWKVQRMPREPRLDLRVLVRGVVIDHGFNQLAGSGRRTRRR